MNQQKPHRAYIGGIWDHLGQLQFDFLKSQGLEPQHVLYDIACGSLRAGVHLIPYLNRGHYCGIEKHEWLLRKGVEIELPESLFAEKQPELIESSEFEFEKFSQRPDFCLAQSLFTHLPKRQILLCLKNLRTVAQRETVFFATFFESDQRVKNAKRQNDAKGWWYTLAQMEHFAKVTDWQVEYVGDWGHPIGQKMLKFC